MVFDHLPPPQRRALEIAVLRQEARDSAIEARAVGTGLTGLLAKIEESGPLLIAVDDAQWLDRASVSSLAFAVHRLEELRVRLLTAIRLEGVPARQPWVTTAFESVLGRDRMIRMSFGPLSIAAMHRVFQEALGTSFTRPLLLRITTVSGGNPFYALEIAREIERVGNPAPGRPLPVPDDHRELARLRLGRLPRATRDELARIAALSRPMAADLDVHALAPAERARIVRVQPDGRVDFTHPCSDPSSTRR